MSAWGLMHYPKAFFVNSTCCARRRMTAFPGFGHPSWLLVNFSLIVMQVMCICHNLCRNAFLIAVVLGHLGHCSDVRFHPFGAHVPGRRVRRLHPWLRAGFGRRELSFALGGQWRW